MAAFVSLLAYLATNAWFFSFLSTIILLLLFVPAVIRFLKWFLPPRLDVRWVCYGLKQVKLSGVVQSEGERWLDEVEVIPGEPIEIGIGIRPKWRYEPVIIEVLGHGSKIQRANLFVKGIRPWEKPYPSPDVHGDYKVVCDGLVLRKGDISDPTLIDVKIEPLSLGERRRKVTVRISTKESRKLFVKDLWLWETERGVHDEKVADNRGF